MLKLVADAPELALMVEACGVRAAGLEGAGSSVRALGCGLEGAGSSMRARGCRL